MTENHLYLMKVRQKLNMGHPSEKYGCGPVFVLQEVEVAKKQLFGVF